MQITELLLVKAPEKPFDKNAFPPESRFYEFPIAIFTAQNAPYKFTWRGEHQDMPRSRRDRQLNFTAAARIIFVGGPHSADEQGRPALDAIEPDAVVFLHPEDAAERGIAEDAWVEVRSRRGRVRCRARLTQREIQGAVFLPFHFREAAANLLTLDELDPDGKIPEFKFCAVRVRRARS